MLEKTMNGRRVGTRVKNHRFSPIFAPSKTRPGKNSRITNRVAPRSEEKIEKIQIKDEPAGFDCELCGHPMVIKLGRYGKFYACSNFPDCRNTKAIVKEIGVTCPVCHEGQVIERKSKKNRIFYGCSRYPECDFTSWDKPVGRPCPKCGQYLVEKKVKGGKQVVCINGDYEENVQK